MINTSLSITSLSIFIWSALIAHSISRCPDVTLIRFLLLWIITGSILRFGSILPHWEIYSNLWYLSHILFCCVGNLENCWQHIRHTYFPVKDYLNPFSTGALTQTVRRLASIILLVWYAQDRRASEIPSR